MTTSLGSQSGNNGDLGYWRQRAEEELALARRSASPKAERFRYQLAGLYFDRHFNGSPDR